MSLSNNGKAGFESLLNALTKLGANRISIVNKTIQTVQKELHGTKLNQIPIMRSWNNLSPNERIKAKSPSFMLNYLGPYHETNASDYSPSKILDGRVNKRIAKQSRSILPSLKKFPDTHPLNPANMIKSLETSIESSPGFKSQQSDEWIYTTAADFAFGLGGIYELKAGNHDYDDYQLKAAIHQLLIYLQKFFEQYDINIGYGNSRSLQVKHSTMSALKPYNAVAPIGNSDLLVNIVEHSQDGETTIPIIVQLERNLELSKFIKGLNVYQEIDFEAISNDSLANDNRFPYGLTTVYRQVMLYMANTGVKTVILLDGQTVLLLQANIESTMGLETGDPGECDNKTLLGEWIQEIKEFDGNFKDKFTTFGFNYAVFDTSKESDETITIQASLLAILLSLGHLPNEELLLSDSEQQLLKHRLIPEPFGRQQIEQEDIEGSKNVKDADNDEYNKDDAYYEDDEHVRGEEGNILLRDAEVLEPPDRKFWTGNSEHKSVFPLSFPGNATVRGCQAENFENNESNFIGEILQKASSKYQICEVFKITKTDWLQSFSFHSFFPYTKDLPDVMIVKVYNFVLLEDEADIDNINELGDAFEEMYKREVSVFKRAARNNYKDLTIPHLLAYGIITYDYKEKEFSDMYLGYFMLMTYIEPHETLTEETIAHKDEGTRLNYYEQATKQLDNIHENLDILHGDICLSNLILDKNDKISVIDFSECSFYPSSTSKEKEKEELKRLFNI